jgi:hypothetical protein
MAKAVLKRKDTLAKKKEANQAAMKQPTSLAPSANQSPTPTPSAEATPAPTFAALS